MGIPAESGHMHKNAWAVIGGVVLLLFAAQLANANIVLTFDQLGIIPSSEPILNYYDGGYGGNGTSSCGYTACGPGPNDGVSFASNALVLTSEAVGGGGNFTNEPSSPNVLFFLTGSGDVMNVPGGITTGFSFYYSGASVEGNGSVDIYSGLNGTGTLLDSFVVDTSLTPLCKSGPSYCVWEPDGVSFSGTAESVVFGGAADFIAWDNITLGSATPSGVVPEPGSSVMLGVAMLGAVVLHRKRSR